MRCASRLPCHPQSYLKASAQPSFLTSDALARQSSYCSIRLHSEDMLQRLPPELQARAIDSLDYQSRIRLTQVNRYFSQFVEPQNCPVTLKEDFVRAAQRWAKHNRLQVFISDAGGRVISWASNAFACYCCFRVRPQKCFSTRQTTRARSKISPRDGRAGAKRFCLECGIEKAYYRAETRIILVEQEYFSDHKRLDPDIQECFFCTACSRLQASTHDSDEVCQCAICGQVSNFKRFCGHIFCESGLTRFITCRQCEKASVTSNKASRNCTFCKRDVCQHCGCQAGSSTGKWWCGRACSEGGFDFLENIQTWKWPIEPLLRKIVDEKRAARALERETDVFEVEGVHDALGLLAL